MHANTRRKWPSEVPDFRLLLSRELTAEALELKVSPDKNQVSADIKNVL